MAWYVTGTIAVSGTTVTGTGTNFLDNTQSIGPGQALLIPGSGTVKMYEIASVQSATKLTLKTSAGTIAAGQAYAILSFYTDSVPDFARRLAAQLSYYQSQMDGWQQIMTGTGSITMTAPDGTNVTISSFSKLTTDIGSALQQRGRPTAFTDVNKIGPDADGLGIWNFQAAADYALPNIPEASAGVLEVFAAGFAAGTQRYTTTVGTMYVRSLAAAWNASSPSWQEWKCVGLGMANSQLAVDANTLTSQGHFGMASTATNIPVASQGILQVQRFVNNVAYVQQTFKTQLPASSTSSNKTFTRTLQSGTWTAWAESLTTNSFGNAAGTVAQGNDSRLNTVNGKSGGDISSSTNINGGLRVSGTTGTVANSNTFGWSAGTLDIVNNPGSSTSAAKILMRMVNTDNSANLAVYTLQNNGVGLAPGGWQTGSDERIKEDIQDIDPEKALNSVLNMRHVTFKMRDTPDGNGGWRKGARSAGYLAQDLEKYLPEAVSTASNPKTFDDEGTQTGFPYECKADDGSILEIEDMKSVDPGKAAAALNGAAIKALYDIIQKQNAVIAELQGRMIAIDGLEQ